MRKGQAKKRPLLPDPKYKDPLVTRFVNSLMKDGKKNLAYSLFYDTIETITDKTEEEGLHRPSAHTTAPVLWLFPRAAVPKCCRSGAAGQRQTSARERREAGWM